MFRRMSPFFTILLVGCFCVIMLRAHGHHEHEHNNGHDHGQSQDHGHSHDVADQYQNNQGYGSSKEVFDEDEVAYSDFDGDNEIGVQTEEAKPPSISPPADDATKRQTDVDAGENADATAGGSAIIERAYEKDDGVVVLTDENFDKFLNENPISLIEFYAPWCGHCKKLAPEYAEAARSLKDIAPLAKLDCTLHKKTAERFDVQGYPTLKFFSKSIGDETSQPMDYDGERDTTSIVNWVKKRVDPNYVPPKEEVVTLTAETFDAFIADKPIMLLEFYAPWCGHCKSLAPEYERAAKKLKEHNIPLAKVDATMEKKIGDQYGVNGFPTLFILRNGRRFEYNGPRNADGIVDHMLEQAQPASTHLKDVKETKNFLLSDDVTIIGFFAAKSGKLFDALIDVANQTRSDYTIAYSTDSAIRKAMKIDGIADSVVVFYPERYWSKYEPQYVRYERKDSTAEELLAFLREKSTPLVGQKTRDNAARRYAHTPLVVIYYNVDFSLQYRDGTQYWRNKVLNIANKYKDQKYRFAIADEEEFAKELTDVGLGDSSLEHNVIVFGVDGKKYSMNGDVYDSDDLAENLEAFLADISKGKVKPYVKSAPAPKNDKSLVRTVVASNFDAIVNNPSKDVLIEFYAPWCGHCKKFEPHYKQFAAKHKTEQPNFVVAKFDGTANDAPTGFSVEGFPTIYFVPAGAGAKPIKYEGNRDLKDLEQFVTKHAVASFKKVVEDGDKIEAKDEF